MSLQGGQFLIRIALLAGPGDLCECHHWSAARSPGSLSVMRVSAGRVFVCVAGVASLLGCSTDDQESGAGCAEAQDGAAAYALRAADLRDSKLQRSVLTTIGAVMDADPFPTQHEPDDLNTQVCAFIFEGTRPGVGPALMLVVGEPSHPPPTGEDPIGGYWFGQAEDGVTEPSWWRAAVPT